MTPLPSNPKIKIKLERGVYAYINAIFLIFKDLADGVDAAYE